MTKQKYEINGKIVEITDEPIITIKDEQGVLIHMLKSEFDKEAKGLPPERKLPENWDEFFELDKTLCINNESSINISDACWKLKYLIEYYNEGWVPHRNEARYCIALNKDFVLVDVISAYSEFLIFKTKELRAHFKKHHANLIIQAAPILFNVKSELIKLK